MRIRTKSRFPRSNIWSSGVELSVIDVRRKCFWIFRRKHQFFLNKIKKSTSVSYNTSTLWEINYAPTWSNAINFRWVKLFLQAMEIKRFWGSKKRSRNKFWKLQHSIYFTRSLVMDSWDIFDRTRIKPLFLGGNSSREQRKKIHVSFWNKS